MLIHQGDPPDDMFVLASLRVELSTPEGERRRLSTVLVLTRASIERLEAEEPETAVALHRWLATTLAVRLTDSQRAYSSLLD